MKRQFLVAAALLLIANVALASWYDDYEAGINAVRKGQWQVVIQKMTAAIAGNAKENNNARTYGNIFINYHPYYYRGLAYMRTGKYDLAISDFEQTTGPGEVDRGSIEELMADAKAKQAAAVTQPEPTPTPTPTPVPIKPPLPVPVPVPVPVPTGPTIDPALRQQVMAAINAANQSLAAARGRNAASTAEYQRAMSTLVDANQRVGAAKSNDDMQAALALANNAKLFADSANVGKPLPPVFDQYQPQLRRALENYFAGEFELAARDFKSLSAKLPTNGWIWAFLGASQYSQYAFEADETYKTAAIESFRKAKQFRTWKGGLPQKYFSKRIRTAFDRG